MFCVLIYKTKTENKRNLNSQLSTLNSVPKSTLGFN